MSLLNPLIPTMEILLHTPLAWAATLTPWLIGIACVLCLIIMAAVPCWIKTAREIDEIFESLSRNSEEQNHNQNEKNIWKMK